MKGKKKLTEIQAYAVMAAKERVDQSHAELQSVLKAVGKELGVDTVNERWGISKDMKYFERLEGK